MMKKYIASLLIGLFAFPIMPAHAGLSETDRAQITIRQRLINPGFESGLAGWTASTAAHLSAITSGVGSGNASAQWAPTAAGETLASGYVTISSGDGLSGANGVVSCRIKTVSGTGLPTIEAFDGTNKQVSVTIAPNTSGYTRSSANFIFPASGTMRLQFTSVASPATVALDDCYLGLADGYNFAQVSQASIWGGIEWTAGNNAWGIAQTSYSALFPANGTNGTAFGNATAPGTAVPSVVANNMPPADYKITFANIAIQSPAGVVGTCQLSDGGGSPLGEIADQRTSTADQHAISIVARVSYTAATSKTFSISCKSPSGTVSLLTSTASYALIEKFPSSSQTAYSANQQSTPLVHVLSGNGSLVTTQGASWLRVRMVGGGGGGAGAGTSAVAGTAGTQTTFGTLTANGGNAATSGTGAGAVSTGTIGADWNGKVIASNGGGAGGNSTGAGTYPIGGVGGGSGIFGGGGASNATNSGSAGAAASGGGGAGAGSPTQGHVAGGGGSGGGGIDAITVGAPLSSYSYSVGGGGSGGVGGDTTGSAGGSGTIEVTEYFGAVNNPIFIGSVTSNTSGQLHTEYARVVCGSSASVSSQSGNWISIANIASNFCAVTFTAGEFSGTPACTWAHESNSTTNIFSVNPTVSSSTAASVGCTFLNTGSSTINTCGGPDTYSVSCTGPR
jgi:hypothetical protein